MHRHNSALGLQKLRSTLLTTASAPVSTVEIWTRICFSLCLLTAAWGPARPSCQQQARTCPTHPGASGPPSLSPLCCWRDDSGQAGQGPDAHAHAMTLSLVAPPFSQTCLSARLQPTQGHAGCWVVTARAQAPGSDDVWMNPRPSRCGATRAKSPVTTQYAVFP